MIEKKLLMRIPKRILSFVLTFAMVVALLPMMSTEVMAASTPTVTWTPGTTGSIDISGSTGEFSSDDITVKTGNSYSQLKPDYDYYKIILNRDTATLTFSRSDTLKFTKIIIYTFGAGTNELWGISGDWANASDGNSIVWTGTPASSVVLSGTTNIYQISKIEFYIYDPANHVHDFDTSTWSYDDTYHWHPCVGDGGNIGCASETGAAKAAHTGGTATCQSKATCEVCGAEYGSKASHSTEVTANGKVLTATCKTPECGYSTTLTLYITPSKEYNGSNISAASCTGSTYAWTITANLSSPSYTYVGRGTTDYPESTTRPSNVGTYTAKATVNGISALADFEITPAVPTVKTSPIGATGLTYDGTEKSLLNTVAATDHGIVSYAIANTASEPASFPITDSADVKTTNAGTYYVYYKINGDTNHSDKVFGPVNVTIAKAAQTIAAPVATTENIKATKITLTTLGVGYGTTKYAKSTTSTAPTAESEWQVSTVFTGLNKNTNYYFFTKYEGDDNYNEIVSTGAPITTKDITNTTLDNIREKSGITDPGITYDGSPVTPEEIYTGTPSVTGVAGTPETPTYSWVGVAPTIYGPSATAPTMPGKYKLVVSVESDEYIGIQEIPFTIIKKNGPSAPVGLSAKSVIGGANGEVTGLISSKTYEYSTDNGVNWNLVDPGSTKIIGLSAGNVLVRESENDTTKAGNSITLVIKTKLAKPSQESVEIEYENHKLSGLNAGKEYVVNGDIVVADAEGKLSIDKYVGSLIKIKENGDATHEESDELALNLSRVNAPSGLSTTEVSADGATKGKIEGLDSGKKYQYRRVGSTAWTDVSDGSTEISELAEGRYEVRLAPTGTSFESVPITVSVKKATATQIPTYGVKGQVKDATTDNFADGLVVNILKGSELVASKTTDTIGSNVGSYEFTGIPNGIYNIEIIDKTDGRTTTQIIMINGRNISVDTITLPDSKAQSKLIIDTSINNTQSNEANYAAAVVDGLDKEAAAVRATEMASDSSITDIKIEMKMTPQENLKVDSAAKNAIESVASAMSGVEFVDIKVEKTIIKPGESTTDTMTTTSTVFEVIVPYDYARKTNVQVIRYHEGAAQAFAEVDSKADCTMRKDEANGLLYFYTNQFSTYAIAYKNAGSGSGTPGGGSGSSGSGSSGSSGGTPILGNGFFFGSLWTGYTTSETIEQSFTITAGKKNVPSGATLVAKEVKSNTVGYKSTLSLLEKVIDVSRAYVYDIKLMKDGVKVQPDGMISVTGKIPDGLDESKVVVYRINDDNSYTKLKSSVKGKKVTFETDHFSHYVIAEEGKKDSAKSAKTGVGFLGL